MYTTRSQDTPAWLGLRSLVVWVVIYGLCWSPEGGVRANTIYGSGALDLQDIFTELSYLYEFDRDGVDISWYTSTIPQSLVAYEAGSLDFFVADVNISASTLEPFDGIQIPMMGTPLVVAVNLPGFTAGDSILMDRETLALIWLGDIRSWQDSRIAAFNPNVSFPDLNITMTYWSPSTSALGYTAIFKEALSAFSPAFATALAAAGNALENLPPTNSPHPWAFPGPAYETGAERINWTRSRPGMMTYLERQGADNINLPYIRLINRANNSVEANAATVQEAMDYYQTLINDGTLTVSLVDTPAAGAWPMSYINYLTLGKNIQPKTGGCSRVNNMLLFLSWTQLNDEVYQTLVDNYFAPLTNPYRRRLIQQLYTITCQDVSVLTTPILMGIGEQYDLLSEWTQDYQTSSYTIKFFNSTSASALSQMQMGDSDFAISQTWQFSSDTSTSASKSRAVTDVGQSSSQSLVSFPAVAFALAPAYQLTAITTADALILDIETLAAIYAGSITSWNDTAIRNLNPGLVSLLPSAKINVVAGCDNSSVLPIMSSAFSTTVQGAQAIAVLAEMTTSSSCLADPVTYLSANNGSLAVWYVTKVITEVRNVQLASLYNAAGTVVQPSQDSIMEAVDDYAEMSDTTVLTMGSGNGSWPLVGYAMLVLYSDYSGSLSNAQGLINWVYWTQTSSTASTIASNYLTGVPGQSAPVLRRTITLLASITSDSQKVFSLAGCVYNGTICSNHGSCITGGSCACNSTWTGDWCQLPQSSSDSTTLAAVLGTVLPVTAAVVLLVILVAVVAVILARRRSGGESDWEISFEELEMGARLGQGGYGEVYKAKWKGSEVAVKVMTSAMAISKEARGRFAQEARIMAHLRHPNVVLFMAASTKPPKMCIVMEFMALGSLYDLIHNDLIPELPFALKLKMIHQAAKGMHFLHSSGIAHRDLKSLNLLLDNRWNVKVSDFGLTGFKESLVGKKGEIEGSVPWMAPEILEEAVEVNFEMADIYAYGIIMWEVLTRRQPYKGMLPPGIAVAVIRNDLRPRIPGDLDDNEKLYAELMTSCWGRDPTLRPSFDHIMSQLKTLVENAGGSSAGEGTKSSSSSTASFRQGTGFHSNTSSSLSDTHSSGLGEGKPKQLGHNKIPRQNISFVICDLARCNESWLSNPAGIAKALKRYVRLVRKLCLAEADGYIFSRANLHSGGTFMVAFRDPSMAATFALSLQQQVAHTAWPAKVSVNLRVALHYHHGASRAPAEDLIHTAYRKEHYSPACELNLRCPPGSVFCSPAFRDLFGGEQSAKFRFRPRGEEAFLLLQHDGQQQQQEEDLSSEDGEEEEDGREWDHGLGLCSSNWCPWIINRQRLSLGREIGHGQFGLVSEGTYHDKTVAVKQLYKGSLDDETMIKMRKEAAILSAIDHPNVVKLVGLSISELAPLLVMELVPRGNLRSILDDSSTKLPWKRRLKMLLGAARGILHLHDNGVLHRDLKSSNLLVDDDWSVKVGDFGFATAKQDNGTMTRCGTPCWTAPEVVSNSEKQTEKADVYSFGIVMWEVLTREVPYQNKNLATVAMDVISGERPPVPSDCPRAYSDMMQRCWSGKPSKRPTMSEIQMYLNSEANGVEV